MILQTVFIISVCNNQLLDWMENELIWMLSFIPGFASTLPKMIAKLHAMKAKYMAAPLPVTSNIKVYFFFVTKQVVDFTSLNPFLYNSGWPLIIAFNFTTYITKI